MARVITHFSDALNINYIIKEIKNLIVSLLFGFNNWFRKYDAICLSANGSDSGYRQLINGKYYNRFIDPIIDELYDYKILMIEVPAPKHFPKKYTYTKNIVSYNLIKLISYFYFFNINTLKEIDLKSLRNLSNIADTIANDYNQLKLFLARKKIFKFLFRLYKPKVIFLTCYYGYLPLIKAAKELEIPVIEIQHGIIGSKHSAYNHKIISNDFYPDYLLTFGDLEKKNPSKSFIFNKNQVYPVGNYYIKYINSKEKNNLLKSLTNNYNHTVAVTLQHTVEKETVSFIFKAANLDPNIIYFLLPRPAKDDFGITLPDNVKVINKINFYEMMNCVDFHSTVYSTCAIEAPSLGVQNILININGYAKDHYVDLLTDEKITRYIETPDEFVHTINTFQKLDKNIIMNSNDRLFVQNYQENIHRFLQIIRLI